MYAGGYALDYWVFASASIVVVGLLSRRLATLARTSDRRFRLGFEQTSVPSALVACDGAFADVNGAMERMLGLPAAELTRTRVTDVTVPAHRPRVLAALQGGGEQEAGAPLEATLRTFAGDEVLGCLTIAPIDDEGALLPLQVEDVTEQRRADEQRAAVARDNALILDCAGDGIFRMDAGRAHRLRQPGRGRAARPAARDADRRRRARPRPPLAHRRPPVPGGGRARSAPPRATARSAGCPTRSSGARTARPSRSTTRARRSARTVA